MSSTNPPDPNVNTFNNLYWINSDAPITQAEADKRYLRFPTAQGTENLKAINVSGVATFNNTAEFNQVANFNTTTTFDGNATFAGTADIIQEAGSEILQQPASTIIATSGANELNRTLVVVNTGTTTTPAFEIFNQTTGYATYFINNADNNAYDNIVQANDNVIASTRPFVLTNSSSSSTNGIRLSNTTSLIGYGGSSDTPTTYVECNGTNVLVNPNIKFPDNSVQSNAYTGAGALAGSYTLSNITLDSNGKITAISSGSATSIVPVGSTIAWAGANTAPTGWLFCQGQAVSRTTYAALFAVIGSLYGNGDGSTTFNLPKMMSGNNSYGIFPAGSAQTTNNGFIVDGGSVNVVYLPSISNANQTNQQISFLQTPQHSHSITFPTSTYVNNVNTTNNTTTGGSGTRAVSDSDSTFPTATDNINYGNLKTQADYVPIYTAFCWIIKY